MRLEIEILKEVGEWDTRCGQRFGTPDAVGEMIMKEEV
jgi:hypothetical protein